MSTKHHLMDSNEETLSVNLLPRIENKCCIKYNQILSVPTEDATKNFGEGLHY